MDKDMFDSLDDTELAKRVKDENCESSLDVLIDRHSAICWRTFSNFSSTMNQSGVCVHDVFGEKDSLIYNAAKTFRPGKSKFSTWLFNQAKFKCMKSIHRGSPKYILMPDESLNFHSLKNSLLEEELEPIDVKSTFSQVLKILDGLEDKRIKKVFQIRYLEGNKNKPWHEVGRMLGVTGQTAVNLHKKGRELIASKMKVKSLFARN
jgi:hypothetical protein